MPVYTFNLCNGDGIAVSLEAFALRNDGATFTKAGEMLDEHITCDHVEVWQGNRAVLARHRFQPILRPVCEMA